MPTYLALFALASWNSYDHSFPEGPTVLATECENDPEPVPFHNSRLVRARVEQEKNHEIRGDTACAQDPLMRSGCSQRKQRNGRKEVARRRGTVIFGKDSATGARISLHPVS